MSFFFGHEHIPVVCSRKNLVRTEQSSGMDAVVNPKDHDLFIFSLTGTPAYIPYYYGLLHAWISTIAVG